MRWRSRFVLTYKHTILTVAVSYCSRSGLMALPHNAKMHYNFANFLRDTDRPELAIAHYHKALQWVSFYISVIHSLYTLGLHQEEQENLTILQLPTFIISYYRLVTLYFSYLANKVIIQLITLNWFTILEITWMYLVF